MAHAKERLEPRRGTQLNDSLPQYRRFLKIEEHRLRLHHNAQGGGLEVARARAELLDVVLRQLFESAAEWCRHNGRNHPPRPIAIAAIGGYGRAELNPYSDVDIMFLHDGRGSNVSPYVTDVVTQVLYLLWDTGFKVGHSTRSIGAAVNLANEDMTSKTSLLEARHIAGERELFQKFREEFEARCVRPPHRTRQYVLWRVENQRQRHEKHGGTVFLQEPDLKNGCGGLRDYQNLMWVSFFRVGASSTRRLVELKLMSESERRALKEGYDFLLRVRTELHYLNRRATDLLTLYHQGQIANRFAYPQKTVLQRSEAFMRDYYRYARAIHLTTQAVSARLSLPEVDAARKSGSFFGLLPGRAAKRERFDGFFSENGVIHFEARDVFHRDPARLMRVFQHAQQRRLDLSPELQQLLRRRVRLVNRNFQYSRQARDTFLAILSRKGEVGRILRMMHEVDFLGRYIPEFGELTCLVQHEFFHRYTADEHTLVCIEKLDGVIDSEERRVALYRKLFESYEDPAVLYLALLLHDTGKAMHQRSHAEVSAMLAGRVCRRLQLSSTRRRAILLLVDNHILLSQTAQTRNLEDPATIEYFAGMIRSRENLDALLLLSRADALGTTEHAWSDWKETLALQLYDATRSAMEHGAEAAVRRGVECGELVTFAKKRLPKDFAEEIAAHAEGMPGQYFLRYEPERIVRHIQLFRSFLEKRAADPEAGLGAVLDWDPHPDQGHTEVAVVTWDRRELFERLAGAFAVAGLNILSADIYTRRDSLVLDIFRVSDNAYGAVASERIVAKIENVLALSLRDPEHSFEPALLEARENQRPGPWADIDFPTRIAVLNDFSQTHTVVEVRTADRLGLLYDLLKGFRAMAIDIGASRISTEKGVAFDTFYITDWKGRKIDNDDDVRSLQQALREAATGAPTPNQMHRAPS